MTTLSSPSIERNDLANLISKSQEYIEILKSIISTESMQNATAERLLPREPQFSHEALAGLEDKVSQIRIAIENDSALLLKLPGNSAVEYSCQQMGFRSPETKTWKIFVAILASLPNTFDFGIAYTYPDGSRKNRQKSREYDARWKLFDELNKKLLAFFRRELNWDFPAGYKLYKNTVTGNDREKSFKFIVDTSLSQTAMPIAPTQNQVNSLHDFEKRFLSYDEDELAKKIMILNDDFSVNSFVHNEPPETLVYVVK